MNKKTKSIFILVISAVLFSVIAFAVPFNRNAVFWVAYVAEILAIVLQCPIFGSSFGGNTAQSKFYGIPIARLGCIYLVVQSVLSVVIFCLGFISSFPTWISVVVCVVVLAVSLIGGISADIAKDTAKKIDSSQAVGTSLVNKVSDSKLKTSLEKFSENLRYSDPVSSPQIAESEKKLSDCFDELKFAVEAGDISKSLDLCQRVNEVLGKRNAICKQYK